MIRLIAVAGFALAVATSAQALTPAPIHQPDSLITPVIAGCGPGRTMVNGVCVARTTVRQTRRAVRRCLRWSEAPALNTSEPTALLEGRRCKANPRRPSDVLRVRSHRK